MITLAYKELIGHFNKIRDYMREFFVYGFKSRGDVGSKSGRTYDNKRRQLESWLGDYMFFRQSSGGRAQFISVDSREVVHNPLYKAFKAKTFTDYDILLHFCLLDMLDENASLPVGIITEKLQNDYFNNMENDIVIDERTIRNKLKSYAKLGLLSIEKKKRNQEFYSLSADYVPLKEWHSAIEFYSEVYPLGVIGSYFLDKKELEGMSSPFWYKHHYMLYALDSEILESLFLAIEEKRCVEITTLSDGKLKSVMEVYPVKIYISTQGGREYLICHRIDKNELIARRIDRITSVKLLGYCTSNEEYIKKYELIRKYMWGVCTGSDKDITHIEMTIHVNSDEAFIINRLEREKRNGRVYKVSDTQYKYVVDTYYGMELLPWIRTFMGRIEKLESSDRMLERRFKSDINQLYCMYFEENESQEIIL